MPKGGFEPPRPIGHYPLKIACLPDSTTSANLLKNHSSFNSPSGNESGIGKSAAGDTTSSSAIFLTIESPLPVGTLALALAGEPSNTLTTVN